MSGRFGGASVPSSAHAPSASAGGGGGGNSSGSGSGGGGGGESSGPGLLSESSASSLRSQLRDLAEARQSVVSARVRHAGALVSALAAPRTLVDVEWPQSVAALEEAMDVSAQHLTQLAGLVTVIDRELRDWERRRGSRGGDSHRSAQLNAIVPYLPMWPSKMCVVEVGMDAIGM
jgi:hypothetical protein